MGANFKISVCSNVMEKQAFSTFSVPQLCHSLISTPENDNIFKAVKPFLKRQMHKTRSYCAIKSMPHGSKSKTVRAQSFQGIAGTGLVYLPKDIQLAEILLDQLMKFPSGRYDDGVDACSASSGTSSRSSIKLNAAPISYRNQPNPQSSKSITRILP
jgi:hypothetical protein